MCDWVMCDWDTGTPNLFNASFHFENKILKTFKKVKENREPCVFLMKDI
jgi:hypothetical protein